MKLLDLGAHDGFVTTWLARNLDGVEATFDGIEANSHGVEVFNERLASLGMAGECKRGLAEDAHVLFEPGTYDVVFAFELIEHVADVDGFLDKIEHMCKPDGQVYLSTPNGTFGDGNNPHHLRVYRAIDLFELCRRRGEVRNMVVGDDTVTVIQYQPKPGWHHRKDIAIYCGQGWEKWHPADVETKGLGGSETAAIRLAESLSESYHVTVYGEVDYCAFKQITFKPHHTFDQLEERHAVIASRSPWLTDRPLVAGTKLLWMHDTDYGQNVTPERTDKFDAIMVLSIWHAEHVMKLYPWLDESKIVVTGNAIEPAYFKESDFRADRPPVALYSSSPDRGLDLLLEMWPAVRDQLPDAELHYCYSSVYDKVAEVTPSLASFRDRVRTLSEQDGVFNLGSLTQPQLAKKMGEVKVWCAPSYNTNIGEPFYETYCIGALEAAAAGAVVIASGWGALPERVEDAANSVLIPPPEDKQGIRKDEWVSAIVNSMLLTAPERSLSALETTWQKRAGDFIGAIESHVAASTR